MSTTNDLIAELINKAYKELKVGDVKLKKIPEKTVTIDIIPFTKIDFDKILFKALFTCR